MLNWKMCIIAPSKVFYANQAWDLNSYTLDTPHGTTMLIVALAQTAFFN